MKALKEKRISLRSLWRMGLVVLSVFALAFAACGDSDSGSGTGPGASSGGSAVVPLRLVVEKYPVSTGPVHEGQIVSLVGIQVKVYYTDNTWKVVDDPSKFAVTPRVYDYRRFSSGGSYTISYTENNVRQVASIPASTLGQHMRLVNIDVTGNMDKQVYKIDDLPDFKGLTIWGYYSASNSVPVYDNPPNWVPGVPSGAQADWYGMPLPVSTDIEDYKWAWVWNADPGSGSYDPNDRPGVLLSVGSYGVIGTDNSGAGVPGNEIPTILQGKRIPVTRLLQVKSLAWDTQPDWSNPVFYDDPTLIGAWPTVNVNINERKARWIDYALQGGTIKLVYDDDSTSEQAYTLTELDTINIGRTENNYTPQTGVGGTWANGLTFGLVDSKGTTLYNPNLDTDGSFTFSSPVPGSMFISNNNTTVLGSPTTYGGGWAEWAALAAPKLRIGFRGKYFDTEIPVYNRPNAITTTVRDGADPTIMSGYNYVYRRPEVMDDFLQRVKVSVEYIRRGNESAKATRDDVYADIVAGICRDAVYFNRNINVTYPSNLPAGAPYPDYGNGATTGYLKSPTLYSLNIFNWNDGVDVAKIRGVLDFARTEEVGFVQTPITGDLTNGAQAGSALTRTATANWEGKQKSVVATIAYVGWAGNPDNTRLVRARTVNVGVTGFAKDVGE